jgi:hypothetical protein
VSVEVSHHALSQPGIMALRCTNTNMDTSIPTFSSSSRTTVFQTFTLQNFKPCCYAFSLKQDEMKAGYHAISKAFRQVGTQAAIETSATLKPSTCNLCKAAGSHIRSLANHGCIGCMHGCWWKSHAWSSYPYNKLQRAQLFGKLFW